MPERKCVAPLKKWMQWMRTKTQVAKGRGSQAARHSGYTGCVQLDTLCCCMWINSLKVELWICIWIFKWICSRTLKKLKTFSTHSFMRWYSMNTSSDYMWIHSFISKTLNLLNIHSTHLSIRWHSMNASSEYKWIHSFNSSTLKLL